MAIDPAINDSFGKAQQLSGVSLSTFIASVSTSTTVFAAQVLLYFCLRRKYPKLYPPISSVYHIQPSSIISIIRDAIRFEPNTTHLDQYFFLRYVRTMTMIFVPSALLITPVLIPLNYIHGKSIGDGVTGLDKLGWSNVGLAHLNRYWAHLFLASLFIGYICWFIWNEIGAYVIIRQNSLHATLRTVLIDSIPGGWMTTAELQTQLQAFPGEIDDIMFNRDYRELSLKVKERAKLAHFLEISETRLIKRATRAGRVQHHLKRETIRRPKSPVYKFLPGFRHDKIDAISFYRAEIQRLTHEIEHLRKAPEEFQLLSSAFITFSNPIAAHIACQTAIHPKAGYMTPRTLPLSPEDIVWDNICMGWWHRSIRVVLSNCLIVALTMIFVVPIAFAGLLSQVIYLTRAIAWLGWIDELPTWALGVIQGILPPTMLAILLCVFSSILSFLVHSQGISSKGIITLKIQDFYFYFLLTQITLLVSLSAGLTTIMDEVTGGASLAATLAKNLPKASNYFLSYVLLQALSVSANALLKINQLMSKLLIGPIMDISITQKLDRDQEQDIEWGTFVPVYTNLACIGFLYAIISPIIIPFQVIIFALFWVIYSHSTTILTKRDGGGLFYPKALKQLLIGIYTMESSLIILFLLVRDSYGRAKCVGQACVMLVVLSLTAVFHHLLCRAFDPLLTFAPTSLNRASLQTVDFRHQTFDLDPTIRIPEDDHGVAEREAVQLRSHGIEAQTNAAKIDSSGKICMGI